MKLLREHIKLPATYSLTVAAANTQTALLQSSKTVQQVTDPTEQQYAVSVGQDIRRHLNLVEKIRKEITKPLVDAQREINKCAGAHVAPLKDALDTIQGMVTKFQQAEQDRVAREEAERAAEVKRLEDAARAPVNGDVSMQELVQYQTEQALQEVIAAPLPEPVKARGAATKQVMRYAVDDINAVYAHSPHLCNPPTIKGSAVLAVCTPEIKVPGLRCWYELDTAIRSR